MTIKELFARGFDYTKLGWSNYIAWWVGAIAYITIIYAFVNFLPKGVLTYILIFIAIMIGSFFTGYTAAKKGVYGAEHQINAETNPYRNIPIGLKEILNYQSTIAAITREIQNYQVQIQICKALHLDSQIPTLKSNIQSAEEYKEKMTDMLNKSVK